jgi:hypothetical protein
MYFDTIAPMIIRAIHQAIQAFGMHRLESESDNQDLIVMALGDLIGGYLSFAQKHVASAEKASETSVRFQARVMNV